MYVVCLSKGKKKKKKTKIDTWENEDDNDEWARFRTYN